MDKASLDSVLAKHKSWLEGIEDGQRADLRKADLRGADLRKADLRKADLRKADLRWDDLREADLRGADLRWAALSGAELRWADLREADLREAELRWADLREAALSGADLREADLDFSCLPLWCGGAHFKCDERLIRQLFAHIVTLDVADASPEVRAAIDAVRVQAKLSHRAQDLGLIKEA